MRHRRKKHISLLLSAAILLSAVHGNAFAYDSFGDAETVKETYYTRYGWDEYKSTEASWTGIDGREYERTNQFEQSMYQDVRITNNELALELGIIERYGDQAGYACGSNIVAVAKAELEAGATEIPLGSNNTKYHEHYGISPCAWCALFISWCADQCGYLETGLYIYSLTCQGIFNHMVSDNGFDYFHTSEAVPFGGSNEVKAGDLVFWINNGEFSHIGLVSEVTNTTVSIISGNAGAADDRVCESTYSRTSAGYSQLWNGYIVSMQYPQSGAEPIINYLLHVMKTTVAGACGALANIEAESNFIADINEFGNGIGYGICQWSYSRRTALEEYCNNRGLDFTTLEGQLSYLQYELETIPDYAETHNAIMYAEETAQGAYYAGKTWCDNFERPRDDYGTVGGYRGNIAMTTYWPQYSDRVRA